MVCTKALCGPVLLHCYFAGFSAPANSLIWFLLSSSHIWMSCYPISPEHFLSPLTRTVKDSYSFFTATKTSAWLCACGELELLNRKLFGLHTEHALHGECSCPPAALDEDPALPPSAAGLTGPRGCRLLIYTSSLVSLWRIIRAFL